MADHAKVVCSGRGDILNTGFGMGLVDTAIQSHDISYHTIIEAHPDVYTRMLATGWGEMPNVRVIFRRWQDVLPQLETYDCKKLTAASQTVAGPCVWFVKECS
ncbi:hypothetical protein R1flu_014020 [Riccia fluitans]|uniref:Uncharacterized protein n=1 Tax=Riccia fluitans TaxID=41844 RepID=A0ABD1YID7_9MARC